MNDQVAKLYAYSSVFSIASCVDRNDGFDLLLKRKVQNLLNRYKESFNVTSEFKTL